MLRYSLLCTVVANLVGASGQQVLPLLSYVPPTSGCNGVAAFNLNLWNNCLGAGSATFTVSPLGCTQMSSWSSNDTMFIAVCSDPCEITILDGLSNICVCGWNFVTSVEESEMPELNIVRSDNVISLTTSRVISDATLSIYSPSGALLANYNLPTGEFWNFHVPEKTGPWIAVITSGQKILFRKVL